MRHTHQAVVVIPFYKTTLTAYEQVALEQGFKILADHKIVCIKPEHLELSPEITAYPFYDTVTFNDDYFKSVTGYNRLMMNEEFYGAFLQYEYLLIYQLDAFVFKDELTYWCSRNFDYIGAPWISGIHHPFLKATKSSIRRYFHTRFNIYHEGVPSRRQTEFAVGNGGFSLRRTKKFYDICKSMKPMIAKYLEAQPSHYFNEDIFWSIEVNRKGKVLNIPGYKTALKFSIEFHPQRAMIINNQVLPFGCHAWDRSIDHWRPIFKGLGYDV